MKRKWKKPMALLLTTAMLTANVGMVAAFASGNEQKEGTKAEESEDKNQVEAPKASPTEGKYKGPQKLTLTSATKDAVIYYTTDGKEPTTKSSKFDAKKPLEITKTTTVKALAVKEGMENSKIVTYTYTLEEGVLTTTDPAPSAEPAPSTEPAPSAEPTPESTPKAEDISDPESTGEAMLTPAAQTAGSAEDTAGDESPTPSEPPADTRTSVSGKWTAKADLMVGDKLADLADAAKYAFTGDIADAVVLEKAEWSNINKKEIIEAGEVYSVSLTLKAAEGYRFTDDSAFTLELNGQPGTKDTSFVSGDGTQCRYIFTLNAPDGKLTLTPQADENTFYEDGTKVELSQSVSGLPLFYRVGADTEWKQYNSAEKITLKADAEGYCKVFYKAEGDSIVSAAVYKIKVAVAPPTASPKGGTYDKTQSVKLTAGEGTKIYYTTDGTTPSKDSTEYTKAISVSKNMVIKAIAYFGNGSQSEVAEFEYVIKEAPKPEVKKITRVEVTGLDRPQKGKKPDRKAKVSSGSHSAVESIEWTANTTTRDEYTNRFRANSTYYAYIVLKAKSGYEYDTDALAKTSGSASDAATINGSRSSIMNVSKNRITIALGYRTASGAAADSAKCTITGISSSYNKGATVTFKVNGTSTVSGRPSPSNEGDERFVPLKYKVSSTEGNLTYNSDLVASHSLRFPSSGSYTLTATFQKQVYNSNTGEWENVDETPISKTAAIKINSSSSNITKRATATPTATKKSNNSDSDSDSKKSKNAKTGDETPIGAVAGAMVVAGLAAIGILVVRKRRSDK